MKGNPEILLVLNSLLKDELTAINQYMVHYKMCDNLGHINLCRAIGGQSIDEMRHAEWLIERILYFDEMPTVSKPDVFKNGKTAIEALHYDYERELYSVKKYSTAINLALDLHDQDTGDLLARILTMEESHVEAKKKQITKIEQTNEFNIREYQTGIMQFDAPALDRNISKRSRKIKILAT